MRLLLFKRGGLLMSPYRKLILISLIYGIFSTLVIYLIDKGFRNSLILVTLWFIGMLIGCYFMFISSLNKSKNGIIMNEWILDFFRIIMDQLDKNKSFLIKTLISLFLSLLAILLVLALITYRTDFGHEYMNNNLDYVLIVVFGFIFSLFVIIELYENRRRTLRELRSFLFFGSLSILCTMLGFLNLIYIQKVWKIAIIAFLIFLFFLYRLWDIRTFRHVGKQKKSSIL